MKTKKLLFEICIFIFFSILLYLTSSIVVLKKALTGRGADRFVLDIGSKDQDSGTPLVSQLQQALKRKGYYVGPTTGVFDSITGNAVKQFKTDVLGNEVVVDSKITPIFFKTIIEQEHEPEDKNSDEEIRKIQQYLNRNYSDVCGLSPVDGIYSAKTHFNIIKAIQSVAECDKIDGKFGADTGSACDEYLKTGMRKDFVYFIQAALRANGFKIQVDGVFGPKTSAAIEKFQRNMRLTVTKSADLSTIKALMVSSGDVNRPALACDCAKQLSFEDAKALYESGYRYVGRYLTGKVKLCNGQRVPKHLTAEEFRNIGAAGLRLFPIFQESKGHLFESFSATQAIEDAHMALDALEALKIPEGTVVYFAVDCDPPGEYIHSKIIPYFKQLCKIIEENGYFVGIYGSRLVCATVSEMGYADFSFVANISYLYRGNVAQKMPDNWAFDQFCELNNEEGQVRQFSLDKVAMSGKDIGVAWDGNSSE